MRYFLVVLLFVFPAFAQPVSETGLPLPRFVSLKGDEAYMRNGPGKRYPVKWNYTRKGLPVKIINEYQHWRKVEDHEGVKGWMHKSVLSGRRTAILRHDAIIMRDKPNEAADGIAKLMKEVIVEVDHCRQDWCEVAVGRKDGWLPVSLLWGGKL
ncbi:MAG: SH3 domain-containing protein [Rickettsiales bacterium]|nr:SH3 domain-containing protein [Rickettsiales bacterium]